VPRCLECILDGTSVASGEIGDDHHVLDVPGRHAEGSGELPEDRGAVVEVGSDHHMGVVKLAGDEPAVVPPLCKTVRRCAAQPSSASASRSTSPICSTSSTIGSGNVAA
jgi:hypothetical protein